MPGCQKCQGARVLPAKVPRASPVQTRRPGAFDKPEARGPRDHRHAIHACAVAHSCGAASRRHLSRRSRIRLRQHEGAAGLGRRCDSGSGGRSARGVWPDGLAAERDGTGCRRRRDGFGRGRDARHRRPVEHGEPEMRDAPLAVVGAVRESCWIGCPPGVVVPGPGDRGLMMIRVVVILASVMAMVVEDGVVVVVGCAVVVRRRVTAAGDDGAVRVTRPVPDLVRERRCQGRGTETREQQPTRARTPAGGHAGILSRADRKENLTLIRHEPGNVGAKVLRARVPGCVQWCISDQRWRLESPLTASARRLRGVSDFSTRGYWPHLGTWHLGTLARRRRANSAPRQIAVIEGYADSKSGPRRQEPSTNGARPFGERLEALHRVDVNPNCQVVFICVVLYEDSVHPSTPALQFAGPRRRSPGRCPPDLVEVCA